MSSLQASIRLHNPAASPYKARTVADLLTCIESALTRDDWGIEPGSIDTNGLTVLRDGVSYRLELTDGDTMDHADWTAYTERVEAVNEAQERIDRDWMADQGDDIAF